MLKITLGFPPEAAEYEYLDVRVQAQESVTFVLAMACLSDMPLIQWGWLPSFAPLVLPRIRVWSCYDRTGYEIEIVFSGQCLIREQ